MSKHQVLPPHRITTGCAAATQQPTPIPESHLMDPQVAWHRWFWSLPETERNRVAEERRAAQKAQGLI